MQCECPSGFRFPLSVLASPGQMPHGFISLPSSAIEMYMRGDLEIDRN